MKMKMKMKMKKKKKRRRNNFLRDPLAGLIWSGHLQPIEHNINI